MVTENIYMISGFIERVTYFNTESGYSVLKIRPDNPRASVARDGTTTIVGFLPKLNRGEAVEFFGTWRDDPKWGFQFQAEMVKPILPSSEHSITRYLADAVTGIGPKTAERIVDHFGERTLEVLNQSPESVRDVPGIKDKQADALIKTWQENVLEREAIIFLQGYGLNAHLAKRIFTEYQEDTIAVVKKNPYQLADEVLGVGFIRADDIAHEMGFELDSAERVGAAISFMLSRLARDGHTYVPRPVLVEKVAEFLRLSNHQELIDGVIEQRLRANLIKREQIEAICLPFFTTRAMKG